MGTHKLVTTRLIDDVKVGYLTATPTTRVVAFGPSGFGVDAKAWRVAYLTAGTITWESGGDAIRLSDITTVTWES